MKKFLRIIAIVSGVIVFGVLVVSAVLWRGDGEESLAEQYETEPVSKGSLVQTVDATGAVKGTAELALAFPLSGTVEQILVSEGQRVKTGDTLLQLDSDDLQLKVRLAQSSLDAAKSNLQLKIAGKSSEERNVYEAEVLKTQTALESAKNDLASAENEYKTLASSLEADIAKAEVVVSSALQNLENKKKDLENILNQNQSDIHIAYEDAMTELDGNSVKLQSALTDMDTILGVDKPDQNDSFEDYLDAKDHQRFLDAQREYITIRDAYTLVTSNISQLSSNAEQSFIDEVVDSTLTLFSDVSDALSHIRDILDDSITGTSFTQAQLDTLKDSIDTARTSMNTEITGLETEKQNIANVTLKVSTNEDTYQHAVDSADNSFKEAEQSLETAKASAESKLATAQSKIDSANNTIALYEADLTIAESNLSLANASPRTVDLAPLRAEVSKAEADLLLAQRNLKDASMKSPVSGVIIDIAVEAGEQVTANATVVSLLADESFTVEVDISESDIVKINIDDPAEFTLDAYGDDVIFSGKVLSIDSGPTVIQDVIYYQVVFSIDTAGRTVKQDMTANVTIFTAKKEDVLYVPQRAVANKNGVTTVRVLQGTEIIEKEIQTGLRGDNGVVEVVSGIQENEEVVVFDRSEKKAKF